MGNIIDLDKYRKDGEFPNDFDKKTLHSSNEKEHGQKHKSVPSASKNDHFEEDQIVNITQMRSEAIKEDRRQAKRTILTEFIAVHIVVPGFGLLKISLADINEKGLAFDLDDKFGQFRKNDKVELRVYLNHQTYFKVDAQVAHINHLPEEGVSRHGCEFIANSLNNEALNYFVKFLENVTASLKKDSGDIMISKINS